MAKKEARSIFFTTHTRKTPTSSPSSMSPYSSPTRTSTCSTTRPSTPLHHTTFSQSMMEENIDIADTIITKWDNTPNNSSSSTFTKVASLFHDDRREAKEFLKCVKNLQTAMRFFITEDSTSLLLVRAQNLMQTAMKRLEKEFYQILSANRDHINPESISGRSSSTDKSRSSTSDYDTESEEDEIIQTEVEEVSTVAMTDLRSIAECMISSGYGKECVKIYKLIRKSIVDKGLYELGLVERRLTSTKEINKMDWEAIDFKIKNWLYAVKNAMKTIFWGERILSDYVFATSESIKESCFSEISKDAALNLFQFPEFVAKGKKSPEKMFRILDLYSAISDLWPEIETIFSFDSTSIVRTQAVNSLIKLGDAVRLMLTDFESAIQKDNSKSSVPGGGLHPLTRYVMNYISFLSDYCGILSDIFADWPLPEHLSLPESYYDNPDSDGENSLTSSIAMRFAWLILVLLCKLDGKAEMYRDVAQSYLFLANNLHYCISKVRTSNLRFLLGEEWISNHESKVKLYASSYEKMGWSRVLSSLPGNPTAVISPEVAVEGFRSFNSAFETAYRTQSSWVVPDTKLRDEIKISLSKKLVSAYRDFYDTNRVVLRGERNLEALVRFTPDDLGNYLSDLFYGGGKISGGGSSSSSSSSNYSLSAHTSSHGGGR